MCVSVGKTKAAGCAPRHALGVGTQEAGAAALVQAGLRQQVHVAVARDLVHVQLLQLLGRVVDDAVCVCV